MNLLKLTTAWILFWTGIGIIGISSWQAVSRISRADTETNIIEQIDKLPAEKQQNTSDVHADWRVENKIPVNIEIPKLKLQVDIIPNQIIQGEWIVSEEHANYLIGSGVIGHGNLVIYAHRRPGLFGNLYQLEVGDIIRVRSSDKIGEYQVQTIGIVQPNQTDILHDTQSDIITLYTCNGWQDEDRLVVRGKYIK